MDTLNVDIAPTVAQCAADLIQRYGRASRPCEPHANTLKGSARSNGGETRIIATIGIHPASAILIYVQTVSIVASTPTEVGVAS